MLFRLLLTLEVNIISPHRVRARVARLCLRVSFIADQCVYVCSSVRGQSSPVCRKLGAFFPPLFGDIGRKLERSGSTRERLSSQNHFRVAHGYQLNPYKSAPDAGLETFSLTLPGRRDDGALNSRSTLAE